MISETHYATIRKVIQDYPSLTLATKNGKCGKVSVISLKTRLISIVSKPIVFVFVFVLFG